MNKYNRADHKTKEFIFTQNHFKWVIMGVCTSCCCGSKDDDESKYLLASGVDTYYGKRNFKRQKHGKGVCSYNNGDVYEGEWKNGERHGLGKYTTSKGKV